MKKLFVLIILLAVLGAAYEYSIRTNKPVPALDTESPITTEAGANKDSFKITMFGGIGVAQSQGDSYLVDQDGHTLYVNKSDETRKKTDKAACAPECEKTWIPYLYDEKTGGIPSNSKDPLLSRFNYYTRADGSHQYSLVSQPLYRYVYDQNQGDVKGAGTTNWEVARP